MEELMGFFLEMAYKKYVAHISESSLSFLNYFITKHKSGSLGPPSRATLRKR